MSLPASLPPLSLYPPALRVQFREEALLQRRQEREAQALQHLKEEEERDSRLEALRNQVRLFISTYSHSLPLLDLTFKMSRRRTFLAAFDPAVPRWF